MVEVSFGRPCLVALCLVNEEGDYKLKDRRWHGHANAR